MSPHNRVEASRLRVREFARVDEAFCAALSSRSTFRLFGPITPPLSLFLQPYRSDLNAARNSSVNSFGCSHAAKCPPLGSRL